MMKKIFFATLFMMVSVLNRRSGHNLKLLLIRPVITLGLFLKKVRGLNLSSRIRATVL